MPVLPDKLSERTRTLSPGLNALLLVSGVEYTLPAAAKAGILILPMELAEVLPIIIVSPKLPIGNWLQIATEVKLQLIGTGI